MAQKSTVPVLTPSEVGDFVKATLAINKVAYIAGPAAIGKSMVVHGVAKQLNVEMIDVRLSQMLSEDLSGLPEKNAQGRAEYVPFASFPLEGDDLPAGKNGWIIFLDELPSASEEVLAATYSLLLDRTLGGKRIHPEARIVAAGNRASDNAIARELPDTLITRMLPVEMKVSKKDWIKWAKNSKNRNDSVIDFINDKDQLYSPIGAADRTENESYATPRGWESVMMIVNLHEKMCRKKTEGEDAAGVPTGTEEFSIEPLSRIAVFQIIAAVGAIAANAFREVYDDAISTPMPWEVATSPSSIRVPGNHAGKVRMIKPLSTHFLESNEEVRSNLMTYVNRLGGECCELFHKEVKAGLGNTSSDRELAQKVADRLGVDLLLGASTKKPQPSVPDDEEGEADSSASTFPAPQNRRGSGLFQS